MTDKSKFTDISARVADKSSPFLGLRQVMELVPVSRSSIYLMIKNGEFPKQKQLGKRAIAWSKKEVMDWIQEKLSSS